jgi:hypothetical protein
VHVFGADAVQVELVEHNRIRQEGIHDKFKRSNHTANRAADCHDHLAIFKTGIRPLASHHLALQQ